jgi:hypothetical protein
VVVSLLLMSVGVVYLVSGISLLIFFRGSGVDELTACWTAEDDAALTEWAVGHPS